MTEFRTAMIMRYFVFILLLKEYLKCKLIYYLLNDHFRDKESINLKDKKFETVDRTRVITGMDSYC
jgi:hypothetical protein